MIILLWQTTSPSLTAVERRSSGVFEGNGKDGILSRNERALKEPLMELLIGSRHVMEFAVRRI